MPNMSITTMIKNFLYLITISSISFFLVYSVYAQPYVMEDVTYDGSIYTYSYTIHNPVAGPVSEIWWWGIYFESDPIADIDDSMYDDEFANTDINDVSPDNWRSTAPVLRGGYYEYYDVQLDANVGFYSVYASDAISDNDSSIGYFYYPPSNPPPPGPPGPPPPPPPSPEWVNLDTWEDIEDASNDPEIDFDYEDTLQPFTGQA